MKIKGIDFTSAPSARKPITCAIAHLDGHRLIIEQLSVCRDFSAFEEEISEKGPWIAGIDFPFGQASTFIRNMQWPCEWKQYVSLIDKLNKQEFVTLLEEYKAGRVQGDKEHRRRIDVLASSISPQKLYGVPVAKMFFEGATRLLRSPVNIVPLRPTADHRIVVEAYPAIVARRFIGRRSYKNDSPAKQTEQHRLARQDIVAGLNSGLLQDEYGLQLVLNEQQKKELISDAMGDSLDAVLCTVQAAWAYLQRDNQYGVPDTSDRCEGWIPDPRFLDGV